mgnify:FL=1
MMEDAICGKNEICENTFGSFSCVCRKGYEMFEENCIDVDECFRKYDACSHFCHNIPGSYICSCPFGYYLNHDRRHCVGTFTHIFPKTKYNLLLLLLTLIVEYFGLYDNDNDVIKSNESFFLRDQEFVNGDYQEFTGTKKIICPTGYYLKNDKCKGKCFVLGQVFNLMIIKEE